MTIAEEPITLRSVEAPIQCLSADITTDAEFQDLVELATTLCGKPMGAVTLLDEVTQLTRASVGMSGPRVMPACQSMCQYTVQKRSMLIVQDFQADQAFSASRAWREERDVRFYAGMPLLTDTGEALGALCVMDSQPATLTAEQQKALETLGRQVSRLIQARQHARAMERMAAERERAQQMFDTILNNLPVTVYLKDQQGRLRFYNQALANRFGVERHAWLGKTSFDLWPRELAEEISEADNAVFRRGSAHTSDVSISEPDGRTSHWRSHKVPCLSAQGEQLLACCSIDLTEQRDREAELHRVRDDLQAANEKLHSLALTDALTGLWNRRAFDARLETGIMAAYRSRRPLSLLLLDVDYFKSINDRFGHPYGDTVLREIADILNRFTRAEDVACRFGGEEFAVLLADTEIGAARYQADRLLNMIREYPWEKVPVTVSMGLAMGMPECTSDDLVDAADAALYRAKRSGKNRVVLHGDPE